jgi:hypothetical protein
LQTGLRIGPIALVLLVAAPVSSLIARVVGTKPVVFTGMALIAVGLGLLSRTTVAGTYLQALPSFVLLGCGTGLALAPSIESVLGSLPRQEAGVGSATSDTALQLGGALGVAVLGTALNIRYQGRLSPLLAHQPVPGAIRHLVLGSLGGALAVAHAVGGGSGAALADVARRSFVSGMDMGLLVGAWVVVAAALVILAALPNRPPPPARVRPIETRRLEPSRAAPDGEVGPDGPAARLRGAGPAGRVTCSGPGLRGRWPVFN